MLQLNPECAAVFEAYTFRQLSLDPKFVEEMRDQAGVAADLVLAALLAVDFLDDDQGDHDLVVFEGKHRVRIMEKHVCIEDVDLLHPCALFAMGGRAFSPGNSNAKSWPTLSFRYSELA